MAITRFNSPAPQPQNLQFFQLPAQLMMQNLAGLQQRYDTNRNLLTAGEEVLESVQAGPIETNKRRLAELQDQFGARMEEFLGEDLGRVGGQVQDFVRRSVRDKDLQAIASVGQQYSTNMQKYQEAVDKGEWDPSMLGAMQKGIAGYDKKGEFDRNFNLPGLGGFHDYKEELLKIYKELPDVAKQYIVEGGGPNSNVPKFLYVEGVKYKTQDYIERAFGAMLSDPAKNFLEQQYEYDQFTNETESYPIYKSDFVKGPDGKYHKVTKVEDSPDGSRYNFFLSKLSNAANSLAQIEDQNISNLQYTPQYKAWLDSKLTPTPNLFDPYQVAIDEDTEVGFSAKAAETNAREIKEGLNMLEENIRNLESQETLTAKQEQELKEKRKLFNEKQSAYVNATVISRQAINDALEKTDMLNNLVDYYSNVFPQMDKSTMKNLFEQGLSQARTIEDVEEYVTNVNETILGSLPQDTGQVVDPRSDPQSTVGYQVTDSPSSVQDSEFRDVQSPLSTLDNRGRKTQWLNLPTSPFPVPRVLASKAGFREVYNQSLENAEQEFMNEVVTFTPPKGSDAEGISDWILEAINSGALVNSMDGRPRSETIRDGIAEADKVTARLTNQFDANGYPKILISREVDGKRKLDLVTIPTLNMDLRKKMGSLLEDDNEISQITAKRYFAGTIPSYEGLRNGETIQDVIDQQQLFALPEGKDNFKNPIKTGVPLGVNEEGQETFLALGVRKVKSDTYQTEEGGPDKKADRYQVYRMRFVPDSDTKYQFIMENGAKKPLNPNISMYAPQEMMAEIFNYLYSE